MYKIVVDYEPTEADSAIVREGITAFNEAILGERDKDFSIFLKNDLEEVFGGLQAFLGTQSVYIETLWVQSSLQAKGYGTKLLDAVEGQAIKNGCKNAGFLKNHIHRKSKEIEKGAVSLDR